MPPETLKRFRCFDHLLTLKTTVALNNADNVSCFFWLLLLTSHDTNSIECRGQFVLLLAPAATQNSLHYNLMFVVVVSVEIVVYGSLQQP